MKKLTTRKMNFFLILFLFFKTQPGWTEELPWSMDYSEENGTRYFSTQESFEHFLETGIYDPKQYTGVEKDEFNYYNVYHQFKVQHDGFHYPHNSLGVKLFHVFVFLLQQAQSSSYKEHFKGRAEKPPGNMFEKIKVSSLQPFFYAANNSINTEYISVKTPDLFKNNPIQEICTNCTSLGFVTIKYGTNSPLPQIKSGLFTISPTDRTNLLQFPPPDPLHISYTHKLTNRPVKNFPIKLYENGSITNLTEPLETFETITGLRGLKVSLNNPKYNSLRDNTLTYTSSSFGTEIEIFPDPRPWEIGKNFPAEILNSGLNKNILSALNKQYWEPFFSNPITHLPTRSFLGLLKQLEAGEFFHDPNFNLESFRQKYWKDIQKNSKNLKFVILNSDWDSKNIMPILKNDEFIYSYTRPTSPFQKEFSEKILRVGGLLNTSIDLETQCKIPTPEEVRPTRYNSLDSRTSPLSSDVLAPSEICSRHHSILSFNKDKFYLSEPKEQYPSPYRQKSSYAESVAISVLSGLLSVGASMTKTSLLSSIDKSLALMPSEGGFEAKNITIYGYDQEAPEMLLNSIPLNLSPNIVLIEDRLTLGPRVISYYLIAHFLCSLASKQIKQDQKSLENTEFEEPPPFLFFGKFLTNACSKIITE